MREQMVVVAFALCLLVASATLGAPVAKVLQWPVTGDPLPDPFLSKASPSNSIVVNYQIFSPLVRYSPKDLSPEPVLARSWESSKDGRTWTIRLRSGVKWHDGTPFTAADVKFTLEALASGKIAGFVAGSFKALRRAEVVDPLTIRLAFSEPVASLMELLAYHVFVAPSHILARTDIADLSSFLSRPVGTGPFKFESFSSGERLVLTGNKDYFEGAPAIDTIVVKVVPEKGAQIAQFKAGQLDLVEVSQDILPSVTTVPGVQIIDVPRVQHVTIMLNNKDPLFQDRRIRQALAIGLDKQTIIEAAYGGKAEPAAGPIPPALGWAYPASVRPYLFEPARARRLLDEAGWKDSDGDGVREKDGKQLAFTLEFFPGFTLEQLVLVAADNWARIGAKVSPVKLEIGALTNNLRNGNFQATAAWLITAADPDMSNYYGTGAPTNYYGYSNRELDRLFLMGRSVTDRKERVKIYARIQQLMKDDQPVIFVAYPRELLAVQPWVRNWPGRDWRNSLPFVWRLDISK